MKKIILLLITYSFVNEAGIQLTADACKWLENIVDQQVKIGQEIATSPNDIFNILLHFQESIKKVGGVADWLKTEEGRDSLFLANEIQDTLLENEVYCDAFIETAKTTKETMLNNFKRIGHRVSGRIVEQKCALKFPSLENPALVAPNHFYEANKVLPNDEKENCYQYFCAGMLHNAYLEQIKQSNLTGIKLGMYGCVVNELR